MSNEFNETIDSLIEAAFAAQREESECKHSGEWRGEDFPEPQPQADPVSVVRPGMQFKVTWYDCIWTVERYHRAGNWVCREPDHGTTCHFHASDIIRGELPHCEP